MPAISIVSSRYVEAARRCDPEFFEPRFLELERTLKSKCDDSLLDRAHSSRTTFDASACEEFMYTEIGDVNLVTGAIAGQLTKRADTPDRAKFLLQGSEILVSTVRPNRGAIGLARREHRGWVASSGFVPLIAQDEKWRSFLFAWLKSHYMTKWLDRHCLASMYPAVAAADVLKAPLLVPDDATLKQVHELVLEIEELTRDGEVLYPGAEAEILGRLGWKATPRPWEFHYVERFSSLQTAGRFDPEFFQPEFARVRAHLEEAGSLRISELCPLLRRGIQPRFVERGDVAVVDSKAVRPEGVEPASDERTDRSFFEDLKSEKGRVRRGDVLLNSTGRGTLGRAACYELTEPAIADNHVTVIRPDPRKCLPAYLSLFLNSPPGQAQSEMFQTGSSGQLELYPSHIANFLVYVPTNSVGEVDLAWQERLAQKLAAAGNFQRRARQKLAKATALIEERFLARQPTNQQG
jgi:type I restriction enzyme S subunit